MLDIKKKTALFLGRVLKFLLSFSPSGGTAAPGLLALKIDDKLVEKLSKQLKDSVIITGTNGKTTTARMTASIFEQAGVDYVHNRTGSNLLRGVASALLKGDYKGKIGLWEVDEAVFPYAVEQIKPKVVVLNNLFRDQLDRYGEIDTLALKWKKALKKLGKDVVVIANADDPVIAGICKEIKAEVIYYGISDKKIGSREISHASDANVCPKCLANLDYEACFVSHLGLYNCPHCGVIQPKKDIECIEYKSNGVDENEVKITDQGEEIKVRLNMPGIYNIYNVLASFGIAKSMGINKKDIVNGFKKFRPAFGRFEKISVDGKNLYIMLVKNPAGFNQVLKTLPEIAGNKSCSCLLILNDLIADGRDVSWIWDVDFELLKKVEIDRLIVSGIRAEDLALRIKYSSIKYKVLCIKYIRKAIDSLLKENGDLFILPTYTAMLETRRILNKLGLVHETWED